MNWDSFLFILNVVFQTYCMHIKSFCGDPSKYKSITFSATSVIKCAYQHSRLNNSVPYIVAHGLSLSRPTPSP